MPYKAAKLRQNTCKTLQLRGNHGGGIAGGRSPSYFYGSIEHSGIDALFLQSAARCMDSVLAQEHQRINGQGALCGNPRRHKAEQQHCEDYAGKDQGIARRCLVDDEGQYTAR